MAFEQNDRRRLTSSNPTEAQQSIELEVGIENFVREFSIGMKNHQILKIINCPSMKAALDLFPLIMIRFFLSFHSALCVHFLINEMKETIDMDFFVENVRSLRNSFLIIFECSRDNSCLIYWRLKDTMQIFSLKTGENSVRFGDFVKNFLFKSLKEHRNGEDNFINLFFFLFSYFS
jgi:hypothetical protein